MLIALADLIDSVSNGWQPPTPITAPSPSLGDFSFASMVHLDTSPDCGTGAQPTDLLIRDEDDMVSGHDDVAGGGP